MGLKPVVRPECPQCGYKLRYMCRDVQQPVHTWVMTDESRKHLANASCVPPLAAVIPLQILPRSQPQAA